MGRTLFAFCVALACACSGSSDNAEPSAHHGKLELVDAPATRDVGAYLTPLIARAKADHKQLVVYVGATWCEPCRYFHAAAAAGQLDDAFGDLRVIVFDFDRDQNPLSDAGYRTAMVPLFAMPNDDGRASGRQIEGSIKGEGSVAQISPRLRTLVDGH